MCENLRIMTSDQAALSSGHGLRRQLGLRDLVLAQVLYVVGGGWVGVAAGLGRGQALTWVAAMLLFFLPTAAVVICLNREMPLEGGLYIWAYRAYGTTLGFLTAWNLLVYGVMNAAVILYEVPSGIAYLIGPTAAWLPESHLASLTIIASIIVAITVAAIHGLNVGKWIQNLGGLAVLLLYVMLIGLPAWALLRHRAIDLSGLAIAMPAVNLHTLALFGQMVFGALCGLEYVAILAGESKLPGKNIGRSVWIASPIICAMFILGTASVVAFRAGGTIDLIAPIPQTLRLALGPNGLGGLLAASAILMLQLRLLGASSFTFTALTRLPMAIGWDGLVPEWFTRLDPKRRTPVNSILCAAVLIFSVDVFAGLGVHAQEAFQLLSNTSIASYGLAYLAMFAVPIAGAMALRKSLPRWLKWLAGVGFLATVFSLVISTYPIVDVVNPKAYAAKLIVVTLLSNATGMIYLKVRMRDIERAKKL